MTVVINGTTGITDVNGTAAAPAITGTDTDTGVFFGTNTVSLSTNGTERLQVDASGNAGLGVTPSAWNSVYKTLQVGAAASVSGRTDNNRMYLWANVFVDSTGSTKYINNDYASYYKQQDGQHQWFYASSGTAGATATFTQAMTLDASGNLGVGSTSISAVGSYRVVEIDGTAGGYLALKQAGAKYGAVGASSGSMFIEAFSAPLIFYTGGADRARIDSSGNLQVGLTNISSYVGSSPVGCIGNAASTAGTNSAAFLHTSASNPYGPFVYFNGTSPNNTTNYFLNCQDTTNQKAVIYSNGTFGSRTSTYGGISDIKVKQDIVDASSQWNDIKALRFRKYRFKDDPTGPLQLGLISQEAELVSPGLVFETPDTTMDEEGNRVETGEVTKSVKYSILYMKAVVALQEAMNRIEQLEADVAALKGNA